MRPRRPLPLLALLLALFSSQPAAGYAPLSDSALRALAGPSAGFDLPAGPLLAPLLHPRVPGTDGHARAQAHLAGFFAHRLPGWTVGWQNSTSRTPATGDREIPFENLVLRRDPPGLAAGDVARLTLAAHYDSLPSLDGFVGAIDSAAPCAILMHVAAALDAGLEAKWRAGHDDHVEPRGLQILFLDGEEPWVSWTDEDSLYGSRSLAEEWASEPYPPHSTFKTPLESISLFVLLDLLGSADPTVPSYYPATHWAYQHLGRVERRMRSLGLLESSPAGARFLPDLDKPADRIGSGGLFIADDHLPFMARGVEVVHLVPTPFPWHLWHRIEDDGDHLDLATVRDWARIVAGFAAGWIELDGFMEGEDGEKAEL